MTTLIENAVNLTVETRCVKEFFFWAKKKHYNTSWVLLLQWYIYSSTGLIAWGNYIFSANDTWEKIDLYNAVKDTNTTIRLIQIYAYGTHASGNTTFVDDISLIGTG